MSIQAAISLHNRHCDSFPCPKHAYKASEIVLTMVLCGGERWGRYVLIMEFSSPQGVFMNMRISMQVARRPPQNEAKPYEIEADHLGAYHDGASVPRLHDGTSGVYESSWL